MFENEFLKRMTRLWPAWILACGTWLGAPSILFSQTAASRTFTEITFPASGLVPGALTGDEDGRLLPAGIRVRPEHHSLTPKQRWNPPSDLLALIPSGHYLELSNVSVHQRKVVPTPMPGAPRPTWRLVIEPATSDHLTEVDLAITCLVGPDRCQRAIVRWDGQEVMTFDSSAASWALRTVKCPSMAFKGRHILEISDADVNESTGSDVLPRSLLLAGIKFSRTVKEAGTSVVLNTPTGEKVMLTVATPAMPVRLWTIGYSNTADTEFLRGQAVTASAQEAPKRMMPDGFDAGLNHTLFEIRRNPDGSQVNDFRAAESRVFSPTNARQFCSVAMTVQFDSPLSGVGTLVGSVKSANGWRVDCDGKTHVFPAQNKHSRFELPGLPIRAGVNRITISAQPTPLGEEWDWSGTRWDWLALDIDGGKVVSQAPGAFGWPLSPETPQPMVNPALDIDPARQVCLDGHASVHDWIFGVNTHNGIMTLNTSPEFAKYVRECRFGFAKGGDGIMEIAPRRPVANVQELRAYYESPLAEQRYRQWYWNANGDQVARTARSFGWPYVAVASGAPLWMLVRQDVGWCVPPKDLEMCAQAVLGGLKVARKVWPELNMLYVWNEPNAGWWQTNQADLEQHGGTAGTYFAQYTKVLNQTIGREIPGVRIFAPTTYDQPFNMAGTLALLSGYRAWYEPLIKTVWNDFHGFDFHFYGLDPAEVLANTQTLQAICLNLHGQTKPIIITESNHVTSVSEGAESPRNEPEGWLGRALPYSRYLLAMAAQPHRLQGSMVHDMEAGDYGLFLPNGNEPTPLARAVHALACLRGTLLGGDFLNPDLTWTATRQDHQLNVAIVTSPRNGGSLSLKMPVSLDGPFDLLRLWLDPATGRLREDSSTVHAKAGVLVLPAMPGSLVVLRSPIRSGGPVTRELRCTTYSASGHIQIIDHRQPTLVWELPVSIEPDNARRSYRLQLATFASEAIDRLQVLWNGNPVKLEGRFVSQASIDPANVHANNTLTVSLANPSEHAPIVVGSACVLATEETPVNQDKD